MTEHHDHRDDCPFKFATLDICDCVEQNMLDRIEALTAKLATCEKYRDAYDECDRIGTQAVRDLEAKLAKAVEVIEWALISWDDHNKHGYNMQGDWVFDARATLTEINNKGDSHD